MCCAAAVMCASDVNGMDDTLIARKAVRSEMGTVTLLNAQKPRSRARSQSLASIVALVNAGARPKSAGLASRMQLNGGLPSDGTIDEPSMEIQGLDFKTFMTNVKREITRGMPSSMRTWEYVQMIAHGKVDESKREEGKRDFINQLILAMTRERYIVDRNGFFNWQRDLSYFKNSNFFKKDPETALRLEFEVFWCWRYFVWEPEMFIHEQPWMPEQLQGASEMLKASWLSKVRWFEGV
jgi:hypothetical protein